MGWLSRTLGYEKPTPVLRVNQRRQDEILRQEGEIAKAVERNNRAVRDAHNDLARAVLVEFMKGRQ